MEAGRVGWVIFRVWVGIVMPGPRPPEIVLAVDERAALERLARAHTTGRQRALRARIVLLAAEGLSTSEVARTLGLDVGTARQWRARWWREHDVPLRELPAAARLADAPKSGAPARITAEQVCRIIALACERPADSARPISQWSARELADEVTRRGIVGRISPRHVGRLLKSGRPAAPSGALLAHPGR
jgi:putative transposase